LAVFVLTFVAAPGAEPEFPRSDVALLGVPVGIGGNESRSAAPKDEVGLKGFNPAIPVICGFNAAAVSPASPLPLVPIPLPIPVGKEDVADIVFAPDSPDFENNESEIVEPAVFALPLLWTGVLLSPAFAFAPEFANANDDATLAMSVPPGFNALLAKLNPEPEVPFV
jgi:hypothetical protein